MSKLYCIRDKYRFPITHARQFAVTFNTSPLKIKEIFKENNSFSFKSYNIEEKIFKKKEIKKLLFLLKLKGIYLILRNNITYYKKIKSSLGVTTDGICEYSLIQAYFENLLNLEDIETIQNFIEENFILNKDYEIIDEDFYFLTEEDCKNTCEYLIKRYNANLDYKLLD
jgi:hypothetical protein